MACLGRMQVSQPSIHRLIAAIRLTAISMAILSDSHRLRANRRYVRLRSISWRLSRLGTRKISKAFSREQFLYHAGTIQYSRIRLVLIQQFRKHRIWVSKIKSTGRRGSRPFQLLIFRYEPLHEIGISFMTIINQTYAQHFLYATHGGLENRRVETGIFDRLVQIRQVLRVIATKLAGRLGIKYLNSCRWVIR